jgi:hypothetical protein
VLAHAERLNDVQPQPLHQAFHALLDKTDGLLNKVAATPEKRPFGKPMDNDCFLPSHWQLLNLSWGTLKTIDDAALEKNIGISAGRAFMDALWVYWIVVGKPAPGEVVKLTFEVCLDARV